ncbi:hypothetical protein LSTR_LSTR017401 [Laodelphax striatellus]|uniref:Uncharacterized protein n=1 Tax=Laodelphax striatellus TaxID=195883 RepID=A0A482WIV6_LAOST|nr:hypothetical protein LSTR_LSTR017401 [Laodelphax striatellus]
MGTRDRASAARYGLDLYGLRAHWVEGTRDGQAILADKSGRRHGWLKSSQNGDVEHDPTKIGKSTKRRKDVIHSCRLTGLRSGLPPKGRTFESIGATLLAGNAMLSDLVVLGSDSPELGLRSVEVKQMALDLKREMRLLLDLEWSRGKRLTVRMANALGGVFTVGGKA